MRTNSKCCCCSCDPKAAAVALGRWCLGVLFLFAGLSKLPNPGGFANYILETFKDTWLPTWLLIPYAHALPFVEPTLGALLILGLWRTPVLFVTGLLLISLTFGQILLQKFDVVHNNAVYVFVTAAILFLGEHDRWVLFPRPRKEPEPSTNPPTE
jgi:thiosulfate dehydrogenase [quinone] large subunit